MPFTSLLVSPPRSSEPRIARARWSVLPPRRPASDRAGRRRAKLGRLDPGLRAVELFHFQFGSDGERRAKRHVKAAGPLADRKRRPQPTGKFLDAFGSLAASELLGHVFRKNRNVWVERQPRAGSRGGGRGAGDGHEMLCRKRQAQAQLSSAPKSVQSRNVPIAGVSGRHRPAPRAATLSDVSTITAREPRGGVRRRGIWLPARGTSPDESPPRRPPPRCRS